MATLLEKCNNIKNDKEVNLRPENLKAGITCLGVMGTLEEGIDTSDATATIDDLVMGKSAYVNGEKIEGNVFELPAGSGTGFTYENGVDIPSMNNILIISTNNAGNYLVRQEGQVTVDVPYTYLSDIIGLREENLVDTGDMILGKRGMLQDLRNGELYTMTSNVQDNGDGTLLIDTKFAYPEEYLGIAMNY